MVLSRVTYENLVAQRRQLGAQNARLRALYDRVDRLTTFLDHVEPLVAALPQCVDEEGERAVTALRTAFAARSWDEAVLRSKQRP
ncbi:hypothetical protein GCM10010483_39860 [Actinokineospora diospyrosa]